MATASGMSSPTPSRVPGLLGCRVSQHKLCMATQLKLPVVFVLATFIALLLGTSCSRALADEPQSSNSKCTANSGATVCVCDPTDSTDKQLKATISGGQTRMELLCKGEMTFAPNQLSDSMVCLAASEGLCQCQLPAVKEGTACVHIKDLLSGEASHVQWTNENIKPESRTDKSMFLSIPEENLPFANKQFIVGCTHADNKKCQVIVTIEAKKTVKQERKVTCAYGKDSNNSKQHQTITLTPSQNSFTLVCGADGDVLPADYNSHYCPVTETPTDAQASCSGNYESIFPAYNSNWWKPSEPKSFTFEVPADQFPEKEAKISLGCQQQAGPEGHVRTASSDATQTSVCNVDVTIEGTGPASSSYGGFASILVFSTAVTAAVAFLNQSL
ncbi:SAG-related sequence [Besnoitia besnoiti]|uniref:SAG-related sequence n=1 Tax=Besnoitia besnoiti TaxID=94643 RepID=A0A2A9MML6_BESBE|nr:SAG-related sequence [Besnoitia besnoiti]PFH36830.1 SAG-related sequence [Besnoitia besnoiti]